ncbi:TetR/AcrR family transcriptional regulator [Thalassospira lucentensis]|uniref:TetR/AcrR family transcriptional regulator n=1 Tax=Thalassospira lucentensis TaxID=168935 RepID=UPI00399D62ED
MNSRIKQRAETRQKILEAARSCFNQFGFEKASTRAIAAQAGVAEGTIFSHFPSKEELVVASLGEHLAEAIERGLHTMEPDWCFVDKLMHIASYRFAQIAFQPGLWQVILQQVVFTPRKGAVQDMMQGSGLLCAVTALIEDAQLDGELNPDIPVNVIRKTIMALFLFTIHQHISLQSFDCEDMCATLRELLEAQVAGLWRAAPDIAA